jgi:hypothetical protein
MTSLATRTLSACAAFALAVAPVAATAKSASNLDDLVGAKAAGAESDMQARGWVLTDGHKGQNAAYTYWWNQGRKDCVMVTTRDGRYAAISDVTSADCNQKSGGSNTGAAVGAVAAGALIAALIASSSHKSGNHDDGQHYSDSQKEADYERGYRDGLHHSPYRASGDKDSYSSGYNNGVEQRERELADNRYGDDNRNTYNNNSNGGYNSGYRNSGGGSAQPAEYKDLVGAKAAGVETDLQSRGFRNVDGFQSGSNGKGTIWWNGRTQQCLQMITVDGRADSIEDIQTHQNCR